MKIFLTLAVYLLFLHPYDVDTQRYSDEAIEIKYFDSIEAAGDHTERRIKRFGLIDSTTYPFKPVLLKGVLQDSLNDDSARVNYLLNRDVTDKLKRYLRDKMAVEKPVEE